MKRLAIGIVVLLVLASAAWFWLRPSNEGESTASAGGPAVELVPDASPAFAEAQRTLMSTASGLAELVRTRAAATPPQKVSRVSTLIDIAEQAGRTLPRDTFEPGAVVAAVGRDRNALFEWVRDHTAFVPYDGALRGPVGVLMDRLGNSLDRALLLAALLDKAGFESRLATGSLDSTSRNKVMAAFGARPRPATPDVESAEKLMTRLATAAGIDDAGLREQYARMTAARDTLKKESLARIAAQTAALLATVPRGADSGAAPTVADHWWVQAEVDGAWIDLDPTLVTAKAGESLMPARETLPVAELGDDRRHTLVIRVMGEVWRNGEPSDEVLLEHEFAPSQFFGQRIALTNIPIDWPGDDAILKSAQPAQAVRQALLDQVEWLPILQIGSGIVVKQSVDDHGELYDNTSPDANTMRLGRNLARVTAQALTGAIDLFSQLPSGDDTKPEPKPKRADVVGFTREWIDFEVKAPGREPVRGTRTIFDSLTPEQRRGGSRGSTSDVDRLKRGFALVGETELLPLFAEMHPAFTANLVATRLQQARPILEALAASGGRSIPDSLKSKVDSLEPLPGVLYDVAHERFRWAPQRAAFLDRLNLIAQRSEIRADGRTPAVKHIAIDFMANGVGVWANANAFETRVQQGVADTVIESAAMPVCATPTAGCQRGDNTSEVYAATDPKSWTVSQGASAVPPGVAASVQPMVASDLASGFAVVSPMTELRTAGRAVTAWWRVHPTTGETLGISADGGSVSAEAVMRAWLALIQMARCAPLARTSPEPGSYHAALLGVCYLSAFFTFSLGTFVSLGVTLPGGPVLAAQLLLLTMSTDWPTVFGV